MCGWRWVLAHIGRTMAVNPTAAVAAAAAAAAAAAEAAAAAAAMAERLGSARACLFHMTLEQWVRIG